MEKRDEENFAVDAIVATSEPQVPKPRTKKPEGGEKKKKKKRTRKKIARSLEVGKTNAELSGDTCQRSSQTLIHSPVVKADRCRLSTPPRLCACDGACSCVCLCVSQGGAVGARHGSFPSSPAHPLPLRTSCFFNFCQFFQKNYFLSGVRVSDYPFIFIYLFIYYIVSLDKELFKHVFCKSIAPMTI
jgi:hypothetical protein